MKLEVTEGCLSFVSDAPFFTGFGNEDVSLVEVRVQTLEAEVSAQDEKHREEVNATGGQDDD